jgi:enoyl-CoA hydratase
MHIERSGDVAVVHLAAGRANSIGPAFLRSLGALLDDLDSDLPGAVVMTGEKRAFSAGLDIPALLDLDREAMGAHMQRFNTTMQRVFELPCPVVAAVNGHAIAGGCVLAMQADERLMVRGPGARIGLNDVTLGIGLPTIVLHSFAAQVGPEACRRVAQQGELVDADEALRLGIVHELVDGESLLSSAHARAAHLASLGQGFVQVKAGLRRPVVERVAADSATDDETWLDTWFSPGARAKLEAVAARLKR